MQPCKTRKIEHWIVENPIGTAKTFEFESSCFSVAKQETEDSPKVLCLPRKAHKKRQTVKRKSPWHGRKTGPRDMRPVQARMGLLPLLMLLFCWTKVRLHIGSLTNIHPLIASILCSLQVWSATWQLFIGVAGCSRGSRESNISYHNGKSRPPSLTRSTKVRQVLIVWMVWNAASYPLSLFDESVKTKFFEDEALSSFRSLYLSSLESQCQKTCAKAANGHPGTRKCFGRCISIEAHQDHPEKLQLISRTQLQLS